MEGRKMRRGLALFLALLLTLSFGSNGNEILAAENESVTLGSKETGFYSEDNSDTDDNSFTVNIGDAPASDTEDNMGSDQTQGSVSEGNIDPADAQGGSADGNTDPADGQGSGSEGNIDPADVQGSGSEGNIDPADVQDSGGEGNAASDNKSGTGSSTNPATNEIVNPDTGKEGSLNTEGSTKADTDTEVEATKKEDGKRFTKNQVISGKKLVFTDNTVSGYHLSAKTVPGNVHLKAGSNSITVCWSLPKKRSDIDGYILLRKSGFSSKYVQIARLKSSKTSYTDKKSLRKNTMYTYCLVSYKKEKALYISEKTSLWAGGVITRSRKVNVYSAVVLNKARLNCLMVGSSALIELKLPKGAVSKTVRWSSEDTAVAVVDSKGKVTAKGAGKVTIRGKLSSGNFVKITVNCMKGGTATSIIAVMESWLKYNERNKKHKGIIDIYNNYGRLPVGYKMSYRDPWCDACISAAAITSGNVNRVGRECGVRRHVEIFKKKGIWIENGTVTPKPGYIIVYSWGKKKQPNNGTPNHIGVVCSVKNGWITTIEGNYKDSVNKRRIPVGWGFIRGYAKPRYKREAAGKAN